MSDVSKLKINNTTYNIKDALALRDAPTDGFEYVRKNGVWTISSGGGGGGGDGIIFNDDTAVIQPGGAYLGNSIEFSNNSAIIRTSEETANGFVKKSGDIMTNSLTISTTTQNYFIANKPNYDSTLATQASDVYTRGFVITDKENRKIGQFRSIHLSENNRLYTEMVASRIISGTEYVHTFGITIDSEGNKGVSLIRAPWITALGLDVESGNCTLNSTNCSSGVIAYRKFGPIINIFTSTPIKLRSAMSSSSITIGTVPDGFRPNYNNYFSVAGNSEKFGAVWINTSGLIAFYKPANVTSFSTDINIYFSACYLNLS